MLTIRSLLIATAVVAAVVYGLRPPEDSDQRAERLARRWVPTTDDLVAPPEELLDASIQVEGVWFRGGTATESFHFKVTGPSTFIAEFSSGGCLDHWSFARLATRSNATVLLDQPVMAYVDACYDRAYLVSYQGFEFLVPGDRVVPFVKGVEVGESALDLSHLALMREGEVDRAFAVELERLEASTDAGDEVVDESP